MELDINDIHKRIKTNGGKIAVVGDADFFSVFRALGCDFFASKNDMTNPDHYTVVLSSVAEFEKFDRGTAPFPIIIPLANGINSETADMSDAYKRRVLGVISGGQT